MIEFISLQLLPWISINSSPVTVQTQDPWVTFAIQFFAVLAGGVIAYLIGNHQQEKAFAQQAEINRENQREAIRLQRESFDRENEIKNPTLKGGVCYGPHSPAILVS
jgi:membrane protein YqaA with SNARE-associated domain